MSWDITDRFPSWGETGESPPTGFFYDGGDQVNEKHLDYLWNSLKGLEDDVQSALDDIDDDSDGTVDSADTADTVKGNDIDSDGDGTVDSADTAAKVKGNDIDSDGDGTVDAADTAAKVKGNDIDSDGDGNVDKADDADTLQGNTPSDLTESLANNSWQDVTANRSAGTTYTNTTGGYLKVSIRLLESSNSSLDGSITVDGQIIDVVEVQTNSETTEESLITTVPPNSDYTLSINSGGLVSWQELTLEVV